MTAAVQSPVREPAPGTARSHAQPHPFAAAGRILGFIARLDRTRSAVWILGIVGVVLAGAASVVALYRTPEDLLSYATVARADVAVKAMLGPGYGLDIPTQGAIVVNEMSMITLIGVAVIVIFMVVRHTRAEEETDRADLVRAAPVGRHAALVATLIWASGFAVVVGLLVALGLTIWVPSVGSAAFGASVAGLALVFIGVAAVTAQIASTARGANSMAGVVLGAMYLVRAVGDVGDRWFTWLSPISWAQGIRAFADERWWMLLPLLLVAACLIVVAVVLSAHRDLGHGLVQQRPGPAEASPRLASPLALAVRLQRASVVSWLLALALVGFFMGLVADQADALAANDAVAAVMAAASGGTITESFLSTIVFMVALLASGFFVGSVLRLHAEEQAMRVSPMLATPVSRRRWLWSHPTVTIVGGVAIMAAAGSFTGLGYASVVGDWNEVLPLLGAGLVWVPALLVLAAFSLALVAAVPRWSALGWLGVSYATVVGLLGETLDMPQWLRDLSPFEHTPHLPAEPFDVVPIAIQLAVAVALAAVATIALRRRDFA